MMAHLLLPLLSSPATIAWLASYLPSLLLSGTILFVLVALALHYLLPLTLRTWFLPRDFKLGHFSLSAVHHLAWEPSPNSDSRFRGIKVTVGSVGFVRWRGGGGAGGGGIKEGLRNAGRKMFMATERDKDRAWFLLRCQDVRVSVSQEALDCLLSSSTMTRTTTTTTGDDDDDQEGATAADDGTQPPPRRARLPARPPPPSALFPLFPQLAPKWQRLLVYFALQLSFLIQVEQVAHIEGTVCAGAEIAHHHQTRRRRRGEGGDEEAEEEERGGGGGADEPEAKAWMRLSRIKIAAASGSRSSTANDETSPSPSPSPDRSSSPDDTAAAVEMLDPLVIRVAAPLVTVPPPPPPPAQPESTTTTSSSTSSSSSSSQPPPALPLPATPRWSLRRGGVRIAIEFGGVEAEGGPTFATAGGRGRDNDETLLVGLAAQAAAAAAEKKEQARRRRGRRLEEEEEEEKMARGGGAAGAGAGVGRGKVARTVVEAGVHVRVQELEAIVARLKDVVATTVAAHEEEEKNGPRAAPPRGGRPSSRSREGGTAEEGETRRPQPEATAKQKKKETEKESRRQRPSPLIFLDSISFELPSFLLTAQHTIPSAVLSSDSDSGDAAAPSAHPHHRHHQEHHLPKEIAFAVLVRDVKAHVEINRSTRDVRKEHRDWFGRERQISWRIGAEWREVEGRVKLDGGEGESRVASRGGLLPKGPLPREYLPVRGY